MDQRRIIIDVRDGKKYRAKRIKGAHNFSHELIMAGQDPDLPKDSSIQLYCSTGNKSARMASELRRRGFTNVESASLDQLESSGHPTEGD